MELERFVRVNEIQQLQIVSITARGDGTQCLYFYSEALQFDYSNYVPDEIFEKIRNLEISRSTTIVDKDISHIEQRISLLQSHLNDYYNKLKSLHSYAPNTVFNHHGRTLSRDEIISDLQTQITGIEQSIENYKKQLDNVKSEIDVLYFDFRHNFMESNKNVILLPLQIERYDGQSLINLIKAMNPNLPNIELNWRRQKKAGNYTSKSPEDTVAYVKN